MILSPSAERDADALEIVAAMDPLDLGFRIGEGRELDGRQDRDDCDHDEQFYECESARR